MKARTKCDRYGQESPLFSDEGTFSIDQFRQTLQQTSQAYDCESAELEQNTEVYNQAVSGINSCLQTMQLYEQQLPLISKSEFRRVVGKSEEIADNSTNNDNKNEHLELPLDDIRQMA